MTGRRSARARHNGHVRPVAPSHLVALGFLGGLAAGVLLAGQQLHRHRRNLFSPRPYERLAALAALRGQPRTVETLRLLDDYVSWETRPLLRRQGKRLLRRMEQRLDATA